MVDCFSFVLFFTIILTAKQAVRKDHLLVRYINLLLNSEFDTPLGYRAIRAVHPVVTFYTSKPKMMYNLLEGVEGIIYRR